ncbi:hypothetical protein WI61_29610 [Burkholderia cepacia]|uniref:hypothetical protein n=1 Tax=Burkholderia cepacia TaxID=292 RepID=UPI00075DDA13|nr:hypothetical protein [Burkholderia cepacia]KVA54990.1 hypothetical protein WI48_20935 [Burkholderia cepacia]KVA56065.1 hypothetical protein WI49_34140 [Burkholderia cepacia]KVA79364.1 hypothetical protein WI50_28915 [Burkholderia cepacia]KVA83147.1 hypothetical protein WI51_23855 [Burkholderia cepacia]KVA83350.1 hypothetical protein WI52_17755 [Burkholderia cepacia]
MSLKAGIDEIARSLDGLHPPWLPAYDLRACAAKVDSECGYGADMMVAIDINTRIFEEIVAFVHSCIRAFVHSCIRAFVHSCIRACVDVCGAFASLQPSTARQYECVRNDSAEIDDVPALNASRA